MLLREVAAGTARDSVLLSVLAAMRGDLVGADPAVEQGDLLGAGDLDALAVLHGMARTKSAASRMPEIVGAGVQL